MASPEFMIRTVTLGKLSANKWPGQLSCEPGTWDIPKLIEDLDDYYIPVSPRAATRCIDGRHNPDLDEKKLGVQVPAGALGSALAYRLGVDKDDLTRGTFYNDADHMIGYYLRHSLHPGGHGDDEARERGIGCGAIDGLQNVISLLIDPALSQDLKRITGHLLAEKFHRDTYLRVLGAAVMLSSRMEGYFHRKDEILARLEERSPGSVTILEGSHKEALVIINMVPGTTLASNRFAANHQGHQAFGYDMWSTLNLAGVLFPLRTQDKDRERFIMARLLATVATLMALTDGTLPILVRAQERIEA